ncbi:MAG TPA: hypothetical protein EYN06_10045, partial [Myxococcales bacterium]|nr:hypothetical protein [Myxococcales bacterium]
MRPNGNLSRTREVLDLMDVYDLDCLFVHVPKADNHYLPFGDFFNITYMPMGVPALSNLLTRHGYTSQIMHLGVEWLNNADFNLIDALDGQKIRAIGLPLYWHYQSYDVIEVAKALKAAHPESFIYLGGITAGYFAEEIARNYECIDGIIKGHAEGGCLALMECLQEDGDLGTVPNLVFKDNSGKVRVNHRLQAHLKTPVPDINSLIYSDLSTMHHPEVYVSSFG